MRLLVLPLLFFLLGCASVEGAPAVRPEAAAEIADYPIGVDLPAGLYRLDPRHASVTFRIRHMDLSWFVGRFNEKNAELTLDPTDPSRSRLSASVAAGSVDTGLAGDEARAFDRQIARALGAADAPVIAFASTSIERTGRFTARISGDLTMNGETHPTVFEATFNGGRVDPLRGGAMVVAFSARAVVDRTLWRVSEWRAFAGDEVDILIEAELVKSRQSD